MYNQVDWSIYLCADRERQSRAIPKGLDHRSAFDSDFGRVIFSSAARRMHDKTQVFPLSGGDSVHTRLTHSMEVLSVAQSLGTDFCRDEEVVRTYGEEVAHLLEQQLPAILRTAAFVHDIGNPPFGHFGEQIIGTYFSDGNGKNYLSDLTEEQQFDFTQFDGNAQGFRILTRMPYLNDLNGLNLTYAVLATSLKYPNSGSKNKKGGASVHKHGVFSSEADVLGRVADACRLRRADGTIKRHPLAFLVEAADTICYRSMDLEDGIQSGMLSLDEALRFLGITPSQDTPERALVNLRVAIIGELTKYALQRFMANLEGIDMGTFDEELLDGNELCEQLGKLEFERIFRHDTIAQAELKGAQVMNSILDRVLPLLMAPKPDWRLNAIISPSMTRLVLAEEYQKRVSANPDHNASANPSSNPVPLTELSDLSTYNRLRLIIDWLSGMTDRYALETYHRLLAL